MFHLEHSPFLNYIWVFCGKRVEYQVMNKSIYGFDMEMLSDN